MRLPNIIKTTDVTNFTKAILKSSYIVLKVVENTKSVRLFFKGS